ncbi:MAG: hypothetical protein OQK12_10845 [Motiliproteus sp.]|nr:hypothetical protein [Motiliproteus sp.]MCW9054274.1 hypothetical protein [Motiliproteus sp.]
MLKMMMAMGAASVMTTMVLAGTASLSLYGMRAVMDSSTQKRKSEKDLSEKTPTEKQRQLTSPPK